jgi:hypothetical protein
MATSGNKRQRVAIIRVVIADTTSNSNKWQGLAIILVVIADTTSNSNNSNKWKQMATRGYYSCCHC